jgi:hypothetical protein
LIKLPYFKFYPGDWQKDPDLKRCSHAAKGVLIDAMCLANETEERGVFISYGIPWTEKDLIEAVGGNADITTRSIAELLLKGRIKKREDGALFIAKMVRDEEIRLKRAEGGKLGGNPSLKVNLPGNLPDNLAPPHVPNQTLNMNMNSSPPASEVGCGEKPRFSVPANEEEAVQWSATAGVPPDFARQVFNQCEGRGWVDGAGQNINSWSHYVKQRYSKTQTVKDGKNGDKHGVKPLGIHELRAVAQAKEGKAQELKRRHCSEVAMGETWNDQNKRQEYFNIKKEIRDINNRISQFA